MKSFSINLYKQFAKQSPINARGNLTAYLHENIEMVSPNRVRPAILIVPGGAYGGICDREGEPIALKFFEKGFQVFLLEYSCGDLAYPNAFKEMAMAMIYVRQHCAEWNIIKNKVVAIGFSAGGHLVGTLGANNELIWRDILKDVGNKEEICPDSIILSYPVVDISGKYKHEDTTKNLTQGNKALGQQLDLYNLINTKSSPAFIWHTYEDNLVPYENSFLLAKAYSENKIPFSFHIYEKGYHGQCMKDLECWEERCLPYLAEECSVWFETCLKWMKENNIKIFEI